MSSLENAKEDLRHILSKVESLTFDRILFGSKPEVDDRFLAEFNAPDDLHEKLLRGPVKALEKRAALYRDSLLEIRKYQPGASLESHQVYVFEPEEDEGAKAFLESVRVPSAAQSAFDVEQIPWQKIHFEARIVKVGNEKAAFLRKTTSGNILARSRKLRLFVRDGSLEQADSPIVLLDDDVDGVYWRKRLYIFHPGSIEMLLGFEEELGAAVETIVATLNETIPISGVDGLIDAASRHWQMARKLQHIAKRDYIASITVADVKRVAKKAGITIEFKKVDGTEHVVYETTDKWALLRILDDDYVTGELTKRLYESTSKNEVTTE